ncbi:mCG144936, partial [Mus musculus]
TPNDLSFWISFSVREQATVTHNSEWSPLHRRHGKQLRMEQNVLTRGPSHLSTLHL